MFWKDQNEEHKRLAGYCWSILKGINRINRSFEADRLKQSSDGKVLTHYLTGFQPKTLAKVGSLSRKLNCPKIFPNFVKSLTCTFYCQHSNDFTWLFLFRQNNNRCCWCHCGCCCWCRCCCCGRRWRQCQSMRQCQQNHLRNKERAIIAFHTNRSNKHICNFQFTSYV